jgi:hypothetical protein
MPGKTDISIYKLNPLFTDLIPKYDYFKIFIKISIGNCISLFRELYLILA